MKHNRSLKEIILNKTRFKEQKYYVLPIHFISTQQIANSSHSNLEAVLKQMQCESFHQEKKEKFVKTCSSQRNLEVPLRIQIKSPKMKAQELKTSKSKGLKDKLKEAENAQISLVDTSKCNISQLDLKLNILSPTNRNISQFDEPKKPKILARQKHFSFLQEFRLGKVLGKGRFGNVYSAQHTATQFLVAAKQISLEKMSQKLIERLTWQIKIQSFLKHQHCLELYKYCRQANNLYLLVEHGDCSLFDKLREKRYFTEVETCYYISQTMKALMHMHEHGIIHRDLKPQNIVLINNIVKLADFGWSIFIRKNSKRTTFCGTLDYVSPEIVMGNEYDEMVDVWGVGVLCYELCTGHAPFESKISREETYRKILNVDLKFPKYLSEDIKDFISRLLTRVPKERMNLQEAMGHRWITKYFMK